VKLSHETISLHTRYPFVIARGGYASHENVVVRIEDDDGLEGLGEAAPNRYYGESTGSVIAALERFAPGSQHQRTAPAPQRAATWQQRILIEQPWQGRV
jgi:L-alanine-DL-glutamate epimerase-like enolase superfamily enzyme